MADDNDYKGLMSICAGAFFGAILGGIIGLILYPLLGLLNVDNTIKWTIVGICIIIGTVALAIREYNKHGKKHA